jgi:hypothetical protein
MFLVAMLGCAALIQGSVGSTIALDPPPQGNVNLQFDAGFSPIGEGDLADEFTAGFGLSARSRVDGDGQMNDVGIHAYLVFPIEVVRPFVRTTLFSVSAYDRDLSLLAPGLGVRLEAGVLLCPGDDGVYCLALQGNGEYDGWYGGNRPAWWGGGTLGIAINWNEEPDF